MEKRVNDILLKNVSLLSKLTEQEVGMMPQTEAPLPSVEQVERIVELVKSIIFPDYTGKRQSDESIRSFNIGEHMVELQRRLTKQIAHGLQFCENCECILTKEAVYREAERLSLEFIDTLPEIKRLLYTDVQAMFDNDPAAPNYGEVIFCYPIVKTMIHYRIAHRLHQLNVPVIPRIITEQAHSQTGIDIHPGAQIGEYFAIDHGTSRTTSPSTPTPPSWGASPLGTTASLEAISGSPTMLPPTRASNNQKLSRVPSTVDLASKRE